MENMEDIVAIRRVETRRVAVRSTDWLDVTGSKHQISEGLKRTLRPTDLYIVSSQVQGIWVIK